MKIVDKDQCFTGRLVKITSLVDADIEEMIVMARDHKIWEHLPFNGADADNYRRELKAALLLKSSGEQHPFTLRDRATQRIIGSTRFFDIYPMHKKLEIGWTWLHPYFWGTGHNLEAKLLLLTYCFESLMLHRVQLKTRDTNLRSQKAILKIGASFEGVLRKDRIMHNGATRDTFMYSIINDEWPQVKQQMEGQLQAILLKSDSTP